MIQIGYFRAFVLVTIIYTVAVSCNNFLAREDDERGIYYDLQYPLIPASTDGGPPEDIIALYEEDASRMTVRMMLDLGGAAAAEIELPAGLTASLTNGLSAIYMASDIAARDSVVDMFHVHTYVLTTVYQINVIAGSAHIFMQAWSAGERFTGHSEIDSLMRRYDLHVKMYNVWSHNNYIALLRSGRPLNAWALAKTFDALADVARSMPTRWLGDGSDITVENGGKSWIYSFWYRWGDCQAGCGGAHQWSFRVSDEGVVTYLGSSGSSLPIR